MQKQFLFFFLLTGALLLLAEYGLFLVGWLDAYTDSIVSNISVQSILIVGASALYIYLGIRFFNRHVITFL